MTDDGRQPTLNDGLTYRDTLVAALHKHGVCYLVPTPQGDEPEVSDADLIVGLASGKDARLRFSLSALLIRQPRLGALAVDLARHSTHPTVKAEIEKQYLAAMYLQRIWHWRLMRKFGAFELLPEVFVPEYGLTDSSVNCGEIGLWELSQRSRFNDWDTWEGVVDLLCECPCESAENIREALLYV